LWNTRNRFIHKGDLKSGSQTTAFIKNYIRELDGLSSSLPTMQVLISRWDAPTDPWVKINFDADFKKELKESCSGLVARNARSEVIFSKTVFHKNIPSTFAAEAMACL
ncbi:hypothetical protein ES319_A13G086600v1, partial [Gossypium barbadense]